MSLKQDLLSGEPNLRHGLVCRVPDRAEHHRDKMFWDLQDPGIFLWIEPSHRAGIKAQGFCTIERVAQGEERLQPATMQPAVRASSFSHTLLPSR